MMVVPAITVCRRLVFRKSVRRGSVFRRRSSLADEFIRDRSEFVGRFLPGESDLLRSGVFYRSQNTLLKLMFASADTTNRHVQLTDAARYTYDARSQAYFYRTFRCEASIFFACLIPHRPARSLLPHCGNCFLQSNTAGAKRCRDTYGPSCSTSSVCQARPALPRMIIAPPRPLRNTRSTLFWMITTGLGTFFAGMALTLVG